MSQDQGQATGQPGSVTTSADPGAGGGTNSGGVPEAIDQAISQLPTDQATAVRKHLESQQVHFTKQQQKLAEEVRLAGQFRRLQQDPNVSKYVQAYESGDLAGFYRRELGLDVNQGMPTSQPKDNPQQSPEGDPGNNANGPSSGDLAAIRKQLEETRMLAQQSQQAVAQMGAQSQAAELDRSHPEWRDYYASMTKYMQDHPTLSLQQALALAKQEQGSPGSSSATKGEAQTPQSPPPPISTGVATSGPPKQYSKDLHVGLQEAFRDAMQQENISLP